MSLLFSALFPALAAAAMFGSYDVEPLRSSSPFFELGRSTAVAVLRTNIEPDPNGGYLLHADNLKFCPGEPVQDVKSLAYACSGFLVAPDLLVTAGHCGVNVGETSNRPFNDESSHCHAFGWLFDHREDERGSVRLRNIPEDNYFRCKEIIYAVREETAPFRDYALVRLERPVPGRTPLKLSRDPVRAGDPLFMIGHPLGSPTKVSSGARALLNDPAHQIMIANLDAFSGNSGSATFNARGEVVGILIGGTPSSDFVEEKTEGGSCRRLNRCDNEGRNCLDTDSEDTVRRFFPSFQRVGSEVQKIAPMIELLKAVR